MDYFKEVYLQKINRFGTDLQQRIVNKKEYDFHHFVERSPDKVKVFRNLEQYSAVLQTKTYNEIETIDYLLCYKTCPLNTGDILKIFNVKNDGTYSYWIIIAKNNFVSAGYDRYTVVKLDREISWVTENGFIFRARVHVSGAGKGMSDRRITNTIKSVEGSIVYLPPQVVTLTMQDNKEIKRGLRTTIKDQVWRISGIDNLTTDGVSYVTLEQDYHSEAEDFKELPEDDMGEVLLADSKYIERWTFNTSLREEERNGQTCVLIPINQEIALNCSASYFDTETSSPLIVTTKGDGIYYNPSDRTIKVEEGAVGSITISLEDSPQISQEFVVIPVQEETIFSVEGPARIKYGVPTKIYSALPFEYISNYPYVKVKDLGEQDNLFVKEVIITEIKKDLELQFRNSEYGDYTKVVQCESPWIGGR